MLHHRTYILDENLDWVVLVHGAGGSSSILFRQLRAYAEQFNVLLVDLRGHGESALIADNRDGERYTFESVSRDVLEVLDHLDIERAHFVGISLGCLIIRTIAELAPERVQSMVLGGAIGNVVDRIRLGYVVDFVEVLIVGWPFPSFNVADSAITVGAVLLIVDALFFSGRQQSARAEG